MPEVTSFPAAFTAGDTVVIRRTLADYPASAGWALGYVLINGTAKITLPASVASGDDHLVTVPAATSAAYAAASYTYVETVSRAGERYTLKSGTVVVKPNLAAATTFDARSSARKALDAINLALETYGAKAYQQSYAIGGRQQSFKSNEEFMLFRDRLLAEVAREEQADALAAGLGTRNKLFVRFGAAR